MSARVYRCVFACVTYRTMPVVPLVPRWPVQSRQASLQHSYTYWLEEDFLAKNTHKCRHESLVYRQTVNEPLKSKHWADKQSHTYRQFTLDKDGAGGAESQTDASVCRSFICQWPCNSLCVCYSSAFVGRQKPSNGVDSYIRIFLSLFVSDRPRRRHDRPAGPCVIHVVHHTTRVHTL